MKMLLRMSFEGFLKRLSLYCIGGVVVYLTLNFIMDRFAAIAIATLMIQFFMFIHLYAKEQVFSANSVWLKNLPIKRKELIKFVIVRNILSFMILGISLVHSIYFLNLIEIYKRPDYSDKVITLSENYFEFMYGIAKGFLSFFWDATVWIATIDTQTITDPIMNTSTLVSLNCIFVGLAATLIYTGNGFLKNISQKQKVIKFRKLTIKDKLLRGSCILMAFLAFVGMDKYLGEVYIISVGLVFVLFSYFYFFKTTFNLKSPVWYTKASAATGLCILFAFSFIYSSYRFNIDSLSPKERFSEVLGNRLLINHYTNKDVSEFFETKGFNSADLKELLSILAQRDGVELLENKRGLIPNYNYRLTNVPFKSVFKHKRSYPPKYYSLFKPENLSFDEVNILIEQNTERHLFKSWVLSKNSMKILSNYLSHRNFSDKEIKNLASSENPNSVYLAILLNNSYDSSSAINWSKDESIKKRKIVSFNRLDLSEHVKENESKLGYSIVTAYNKHKTHHSGRKVSSLSTPVRLSTELPKYDRGYLYCSTNSF